MPLVAFENQINPQPCNESVTNQNWRNLRQFIDAVASAENPSFDTLETDGILNVENISDVQNLSVNNINDVQNIFVENIDAFSIVVIDITLDGDLIINGEKLFVPHAGCGITITSDDDGETGVFSVNKIHLAGKKDDTGLLPGTVDDECYIGIDTF